MDPTRVGRHFFSPFKYLSIYFPNIRAVRPKERKSHKDGHFSVQFQSFQSQVICFILVATVYSFIVN